MQDYSGNSSFLGSGECHTTTDSIDYISTGNDATHSTMQSPDIVSHACAYAQLAGPWAYQSVYFVELEREGKNFQTTGGRGSC